MKLDGKVAVITGGAQGIGASIAHLFAAQGARVVLWDRSESVIRVAEELVSEGFSATSDCVDVSSEQAVMKAAQHVLSEHGAADILVNNAGIANICPVDKMTYDQWDAIIRINLGGAFLCSRAFLPEMCKQGFGRIVMMSSVVARDGWPGLAHYAASKSALLGFARSLAKEVGGTGTTVNVVAPGLIKTPMTFPNEDYNRQEEIDKIAVQRVGQPQDVANACLYFCSEQAGFVTGQTLYVDGG